MRILSILVFYLGYLLGVFDGHGGASCAHVLAKRLLSYIAACLPSQHVSSKLIEQMTPSMEYRPEIELLYAHEFHQYHASVSHLRDTVSTHESQSGIDSIERALVTAFEALDHQLSEEALAFLLGREMGDVLQKVPRWDWKPWWKEMQAQSGKEKLLQLATLSVAMSGAVACTAHISSSSLVIANTGDCQV